MEILTVILIMVVVFWLVKSPLLKLALFQLRKTEIIMV